jgi:hypothetical protein
MKRLRALSAVTYFKHCCPNHRLEVPQFTPPPTSGNTRADRKFASSPSNDEDLATRSNRSSLSSNFNRVKDSPSIVTTGATNGHELPPGARAFVECDRNALMDLFYKFAIECSVSGKSLDRNGLEKLLRAVGETVDGDTLEQIFQASDLDGSGSIDLNVCYYYYVMEPPVLHTS